MADIQADILERLEKLERNYGTHLGPQPGATSLNRPHTGIPYLNSDGELEITVIPTGTTSTEVALGNHAHVSGYYL